MGLESKSKSLCLDITVHVCITLFINHRPPPGVFFSSALSSLLRVIRIKNALFVTLTEILSLVASASMLELSKVVAKQAEEGKIGFIRSASDPAGIQQLGDHISGKIVDVFTQAGHEEAGPVFSELSPIGHQEDLQTSAWVDQGLGMDTGKKVVDLGGMVTSHTAGEAFFFKLLFFVLMTKTMLPLT
ncbi:hypothetical protein L1987_85393 [Smallanthus sonchifolius]|uniref:Uncharacterized protein n=1 Tax=Smallanthus sonchifolius TaxID=185202 RepID=A0ACB8XX47_9ASTR|nr:hypothetical protein L1987_85393 [Smallanthus sonchifolius]